MIINIHCFVKYIVTHICHAITSALLKLGCGNMRIIYIPHFHVDIITYPCFIRTIHPHVTGPLCHKFMIGCFLRSKQIIPNFDHVLLSVYADSWIRNWLANESIRLPFHNRSFEYGTYSCPAYISPTRNTPTRWSPVFKCTKTLKLSIKLGGSLHFANAIFRGSPWDLASHTLSFTIYITDKNTVHIV